MPPETHLPRQYIVPTPDGKTVTLVRTWTDTQIESMLESALRIVDALDPPEDLRTQTFGVAVNMIGQMAPKQSGVVVPPMSAIDMNGRR